VSPAAAGALIARLLAYAAVALAGGFLLQRVRPGLPLGAAAAVLFCGALLTGVLVEARRGRA
jgi:hypothetical protein